MTANYSFLYLVTVCFLSFTCVWGMSHKTWCFFLRRALGTEQERTREWCLVSQGLLKGHGLSEASRWKLEMPWAVTVWEAAGEGHSVEVSPGGCWAGWGDTDAWLGGSLWYATIIWWQYPQAIPKECQGGSSLSGLLLLRCWQEAGAAEGGNILACSPSCSGGSLAWSGSQSSTWQCQPRQALSHCLRGRQIACGQRRGDERERGN